MSEQFLNSKENFYSKQKILSPKIDVVFQALFGEIGCEKITKGFLKSILKKEISEVDLSQNVVLRRERQDDKLGILDVIAKINEKENCNIEMQIDDTGEIKERILYYWSRVYARQLKKSERYGELEKTIVILITNFEMKGLEELDYHTEWKIIDRKTKTVILTDKLEFHIIEMPKVKEELIEWSKKFKEKGGKDMDDNQEERDELLDWIHFLQESLSDYVIEKTKDNEELREAVKKLKEISEDEQMQRIADLREKAILDQNSRMHSVLTKGMEEGIKKGKLETAKKMLEENIPIEVIIKVTGLSKEEITSS